MTFPLHILNIIGKFQLLCGGVFEKIQKVFTLNSIQWNLHVWYVTYSPLRKKSLNVIIYISQKECFMDIKLLVGKRVKELRNKLGVSQEELADILWAAQETRSRYKQLLTVCGDVVKSQFSYWRCAA